MVDEVLAVGDAEFQKKCLGKMGEVAKEGRTVLFVSHNMAAVSNLCPKSILLTSGELEQFDVSSRVIEDYLRIVPTDKGDINQYRPNWASRYITSASLVDHDGTARGSVSMGSELVFEICFDCPSGTSISKPIMGLVINHGSRGSVGGVNMRMTNAEYDHSHYSSGKITCAITNLPLLQGQYTVDFWLGEGQVDLDAIIGYVSFSVEEADVYGTGKLPFSFIGVNYLKPDWSIVKYD